VANGDSGSADGGVDSGVSTTYSAQGIPYGYGPYVPPPPVLNGATPFDQLMQLLEIVNSPAGSTVTGDQVKQLLGQIGLQAVPARQATITEGLINQQRLAAGSPREVFTEFNDQINQIQQQLAQQSQTIARQGGFALGGQRRRAQGAAFGQAATGLQSVFGQAQNQGQRGLLQLATTIRPLTAVGSGSESVSNKPFDFSQFGAAAGDLTQLVQRALKPPQEQPLSAPFQSAQLPLGTSPTLSYIPPPTYAPPPTVYGGYGAP